MSDILQPKAAGVQVIEGSYGEDLQEEIAAEQFNSFFVKKIAALSQRIPDPRDTDPLAGPGKKMNGKNLRFTLKTTSVEEVKMIILGLKNSQATGVDGIPTSILKKGVEVPCLTIRWMINRSIISSVFPDMWKQSIIVPILKKGSARVLKNYRPCSCKSVHNIKSTGNCIVQRQVSNYFEQNGLFPKNQHGFQMNRSATTAMTSLH